MSDLVKMARGIPSYGFEVDGVDITKLARDMADKIEQLERELAEWQVRNERNKTVAANATVLASDRGFEIEELQDQLAAEKALADRLYHAITDIDPSYDLKSRACTAYRKARGL